MSHDSVIKNVTRRLQKTITQNEIEYSEYSKSLRAKITKITTEDYQADFDTVFGDFETKKLPRDGLYFKVK